MSDDTLTDANVFWNITTAIAAGDGYIWRYGHSQKHGGHFVNDKEEIASSDIVYEWAKRANSALNK